MQKKSPLKRWAAVVIAVFFAGLAAQLLALSLSTPKTDTTHAFLLADPQMVAASYSNTSSEPSSVSLVSLKLSQDTSAVLPVKVDAALTVPTDPQSIFEAKVLKLVNAERTKRGLRRLTLSTKLASAARAHSVDMSSQNYFSHSGLNGSTFTDRFAAVGYQWTAAGENLYAGNGSFNTAAQTVKAWMNSTGHRKILLSKAYTQIGIGYSYNANSTYGGYVTADFGKPR